MPICRRLNLWNRSSGQGFFHIEVDISRTLLKNNFVQFEAIIFEWHHSEYAKKRNFKKNSHIKMAVSSKLLNQMQFNDWHFEGLQKYFKFRCLNVFSIKFQFWRNLKCDPLLTVPCCSQGVEKTRDC